MTNTCFTNVEITMAYLPYSPAQSLTDPTRLSQNQAHNIESQIITFFPFCKAPSPHTYSFTFSFNCTVNNCAVRSRVCGKFRRFVQL